MKLSIFWLFLFAILAGCGRTSGVDPVKYRNGITEWQQKRDKRIHSQDSWLTVCELSWLKEGENTFGSDSTAAIMLPKGKALPIAGSIWVEKGHFRLTTKPGSNVKVNDSLVTNFPNLLPDADTAGPSVVSIGSVNFFVIKRADKIGVRVKDKESPNRLEGIPLAFFPIDPKWRIEGKFEPYSPKKILPISTVINTVEPDTCPGAIVFQVDGKTYRLEVTQEVGTTDQLYIMFSDETSGKETYGAGRQLYTDIPDSNSNVVIDFNKAINWPCDYTDFATCPIPPPQNHLVLRVEAGEKKYPGKKE